MMSDGFDRILQYATEFYEGLDCRYAASFNRAYVMDAYERLNRLRNRYMYERYKIEA